MLKEFLLCLLKVLPAVWIIYSYGFVLGRSIYLWIEHGIPIFHPDIGFAFQFYFLVFAPVWMALIPDVRDEGESVHTYQLEVVGGAFLLAAICATLKRR